MSLFTFKELWAVECGDGHNEFTSGSLVWSNFDNSPDGSVKFALGSLTGILRIIGHTSYEDIHDTTVSILAEVNLGYPILQIESDVFIGGSDDINLAILHPFKLAVYGVSKLAGQVEHGSQYKVTLLYEHILKRHAFNMCCGPFGHGTSFAKTNKDRPSKSKRRFICVQSLDGTLSFFEQELFTFCRYLPGFLLPGPLAYVPAWDSFITASWNVVCFKYTSLAMSKDDQQQSQDTSVGKRLTPDWSFCIGEECIGDIKVLSTDDPATSCVVVCSFRNIMCFGDGGILIWTKRLDFQISYFHSFLVPISPNEHECITIAGSSNEPYNCYVYSGTMLRWAARLPFAPIHIDRVFNYKNINGAILAMSERGTVILGFIGTVPSLFVAPPVQSRDLDYEAAEKELNDLRRAITAAGDQEVSASKDSTVEIKLEFEGQKTKWIETNGLEVMSLIGVVKLMCHLKVNDVRVTFSTPKPIICSPDSVLIGDIIGRHSYPVEFYVENEIVPSDLQCDVFVFYISDNGSPHFVQKCGIRIPLFIVAKPHHKLEKDGNVKITFSVNKPVVNLLSLYNDFNWSIDGAAPGISFMFQCGEIASLLSSTKNASSETSKYRIQAHTLAIIYVIFRDFIDRLNRKLGRDKTELVIEPLGLDEEMSLLTDYFQEIDAHAVQRQRDAQIQDEISNRAAQLRAIQRRYGTFVSSLKRDESEFRYCSSDSGTRTHFP
ncbi:protein PTHB1-like isoform X2 [Folsomia candida]|uniref:protein PTHB1-like isoform X2 n=1 Tax=Folsomia candida TaxID=158441 RepID=UPI00160512A4|nr:protein PTHB1-like isoform X2 [Folsomia candida]